MKRIDDLFDVKYGVNLELNALSICDKDNPNAVNFVARTAANNGVSAIVEKIADVDPILSGTISVAAGGSVLETFLQPEPYYSGRDLFYLTPKVEMLDEVKLYYCTCIRANKYKYNYGRQANKTLKDLLIPDLSEIPNWVFSTPLPTCDGLDNSLNNDTIKINTDSWKVFRYDEVFEIKKGYYNKKPEHHIPGNIPFIGATRNNNGITDFYSLEDISLYRRDGSINYDELNKKLFQGNCITVVNNGESVAYAFYREQEFTCSHDVNPLYLKGYTLNKYIAFFLIGLIKREKYRWNYGRKWRPIRMEKSEIKLPIKEDGSPDFDFMEGYVKSTKYSSTI